MILSDLLGRPVLDADERMLGQVLDARFVIDGAPAQLLAETRLAGLIVSPHTGTTFLGYERIDENSPWLIAAFLRWRHRGSFYVHWEDIEKLTERGVVLAPTYIRRSPALPSQ